MYRATSNRSSGWQIRGARAVSDGGSGAASERERIGRALGTRPPIFALQASTRRRSQEGSSRPVRSTTTPVLPKVIVLLAISGSAPGSCRRGPHERGDEARVEDPAPGGTQAVPCGSRGLRRSRRTPKGTSARQRIVYASDVQARLTDRSALPPSSSPDPSSSPATVRHRAGAHHSTRFMASAVEGAGARTS
jgi:hypothetical protein